MRHRCLTQIKIIVAPLAEKLLASLREHKRATLVASNALAALLDDTAPRPPRFRDESRSMRADRECAAPLEIIKTQAERMRFGVLPNADQEAAANLVSESSGRSRGSRLETYANAEPSSSAAACAMDENNARTRVEHLCAGVMVSP